VRAGEHLDAEIAAFNRQCATANMTVAQWNRCKAWQDRIFAEKPRLLHESEALARQGK
jgi:hypothetical protein